jgi:hypothetical protein
MKFSQLNDPNSWDVKGVKTIKFPFNIENVLRFIFKISDWIKMRGNLG